MNNQPSESGGQWFTVMPSVRVEPRRCGRCGAKARPGQQWFSPEDVVSAGGLYLCQLHGLEYQARLLGRRGISSLADVPTMTAQELNELEEKVAERRRQLSAVKRRIRLLNRRREELRARLAQLEQEVANLSELVLPEESSSNGQSSSAVAAN